MNWKCEMAHVGQREPIRFYCSPDGHSCKWLLPMVAQTKYPSWDDLTDMFLDDLAVEIERRHEQMKVKIGKYKTYWGPYQVAELLKYLGVSEERQTRIGEWLSNTWMDEFLNWVHIKRGDQSVKVRIDPYDTWSMDCTLAHIILPMLKQLKETTHGAPIINLEDVPEHLHPSKEEIEQHSKDGTVDENFFARWDWILDEMIFAFESLVDDQDSTTEEMIAVQPRVNNGFRLFGTYFTNLWD